MSCPLCKKEAPRSFPIHYYLGKKRFEAVQCRACGFIYLLPRLTDKDLQELYSDQYFLYDGADCGAHSMTDYETAAIQGSVKFPEILGYIQVFRPSGRFFEVGCGMGYFLDFVRSHGYQVSGIEYAELGARTCREKFGLDVLRSSFESFPEEPGKYDIIFLGDVLEHLLQPLEMLQKASRMLKPGGVVAVEVPSMFNSIVGRLAVLGYRVMGRSKEMTMPPYHVNEFLPSTLARILHEAGFSTTKIIQRVKSPGTISLRGNVFEKVTKKSLQYPNYAATKALGILGDRLVGIGVR